MNASFVGLPDKGSDGNHDLFFRKCNFFGITAFKLKNNFLGGDMSFHGLLFPVPLVSKGQCLVGVYPIKLLYQLGFHPLNERR